jgi:hypothetical protein
MVIDRTEIFPGFIFLQMLARVPVKSAATGSAPPAKRLILGLLFFLFS